MRTGKGYPSRLSPGGHAQDPVWASEARRELLAVVPIPRLPRTRYREDGDTRSTSLLQSPSDQNDLYYRIPPKRFGGRKGRRPHH